MNERVIEPIQKAKRKWGNPGDTNNPRTILIRWEQGKIVSSLVFECLGADESNMLFVEADMVDEEGRHRGERVRMPIGLDYNSDGWEFAFRKQRFEMEKRCENLNATS